MSLLATYKTKLGKVNLHHENGRFETRGVIVCPDVEHPCGVQSYVTTIHISAKGALEWWELAEDEGHVYLPFPAAEAATVERNPS